ncbi:MAG: methylcobamide--CoM methyltransferase [Hadesarchaea archaeon]|nr:methylcobamide--CoM methyltransferase [Hadesarchaea archaeon]
MELLTANTGSYPRIGDKPEQQKHRQAYARWEKGEISDEEFMRVQDEVTIEVIQEQVRAGLDLVTDGQVRWYDPISHFARRLGGFVINGLLRFFDTNFYFRQPVVEGKVRWMGPILIEEFSFAKGVSPVPVKPVITGPYTIARSSINRHYSNIEELVLDLASAIGREVGELEKAGAEIIQIDEPAILRNPEDLELFRNAIEEMRKHLKSARLALYTYFGDAAEIYEELQELPVDIIGLDFTYSDSLVDVIVDKGSSKGLGLGLIDGRNTRMENEAEILSVLEQIVPNVEGRPIYLNPSCGLEYLPRETAFAKLRNLVAIADKAREVLR